AGWGGGVGGARPGGRVGGVGHGDQLHAVAHARGEMVEERGGAKVLGQALESAPPVLGGTGPALDQAVERVVEALALDRLEQVVDGVHLERLYGVLVVRGGGDDHGSGRQAVQGREFREARRGDGRAEDG